MQIRPWKHFFQQLVQSLKSEMVDGRVEKGKRGPIGPQNSENNAMGVLRTKQMSNHSENAMQQPIWNAFQWHYIDSIDEEMYQFLSLGTCELLRRVIFEFFMAIIVMIEEISLQLYQSLRRELYNFGQKWEFGLEHSENGLFIWMWHHLFIKTNHILYDFLIFQVKVHLPEVKFINLGNRFLIIYACFKQSIVKTHHVLVSQQMEQSQKTLLLTQHVLQ